MDSQKLLVQQIIDDRAAVTVAGLRATQGQKYVACLFTLFELIAGVAKADRNNDGEVTWIERITVGIESTGTIFGLIKQSKEAYNELKQTYQGLTFKGYLEVLQYDIKLVIEEKFPDELAHKEAEFDSKFAAVVKILDGIEDLLY